MLRNSYLLFVAGIIALAVSYYTFNVFIFFLAVILFAIGLFFSIRSWYKNKLKNNLLLTLGSIMLNGFVLLFLLYLIVVFALFALAGGNY